MIRIKHKNGREVQFPDRFLPEVCLQVCGGGYTTRQTADAMVLQETLREERTATHNGIVVTLTD